MAHAANAAAVPPVHLLAQGLRGQGWGRAPARSSTPRTTTLWGHHPEGDFSYSRSGSNRKGR